MYPAKGFEMAGEKLKQACVRLSSMIDPIAEEDRRWQQEEGALLKAAIGWAKELMSESGQFKLVDSPPTVQETKELRLVHEPTGREAATITFKIGQGHLMIWGKANEEPGFTAFNPGKQWSAELAAVDTDWVESALAEFVGSLNFMDR
jgi:hypothetical protein